MKKIMLIVMVVLIMVGCSTIPNEYKVVPNQSEVIYIESGAKWGVIISILSAYTFYYLDNKAQWY